MKRNGRYLKILILFFVLVINLSTMNSVVHAIDENELEDGVEIQGPTAPYPASPYIDENRDAWTTEDETDSFGPRSKKKNWEYDSLQQFERQLIKQYNSTSRDCGYGRAAYQCSGLLMRGLYKPGGDYYVPWSVSPKAKARGNVLSFTYLRRDVGFHRFPFTYTAGFIAYPKMVLAEKRKNQIDLQPLCYFPADGYTDYRDEYGCGKTTQVVIKDRQFEVNTDYSQRCQDIGVTSFERWRNHYQKSHRNLFYQEQCGFDLRNEKYASGNTNIGLRATNYIQNVNHTFRHPEIITTGWPTEEEGLVVKKVPFMAFFYIENTGNESLSAAQRMQKDYYDRTGVFVPVVQVKLPRYQKDSARINVTQEMQNPEVPMQ